MLNFAAAAALPLLALLPAPAASQPAAPLAFETASVRADATWGDPSSLFPLGPGIVYASTGGRFHAANIPLLAYISFAYKLTAAQEAAVELQGPHWLYDAFDIDARAADPNATKDDMRRMMQTLLAERFHLAMHTEMKQGPAFALRLARPPSTGPSLQPHPASQPCTAASAVTFHVPTSGSVPVSCGGVAEHLNASGQGVRRAGGRNVSLALLASVLPRLGDLDLPVVDQTGLSGNYDFILEWTPRGDHTLSTDGFSAGEGAPSVIPPINHPPAADIQLNPTYSGSPGAPSGQHFEDALKTELGLKLVKTTAPTEVYVLDHIERPTPN